MVDSINASAGKLSDVIENKTPDVISHERSEFQNVSNIQPEVFFKENIHDQGAMESGHDLLKAESAAKKAASKPVQQRHSGKVNESTSHPAIEDEEAVKLERMNANYEHDRAILAKTDPAFAKNRFLDVGHVERDDDYLERQELDKIRRMALDSEIRNSRGIIQ